MTRIKLTTAMINSRTNARLATLQKAGASFNRGENPRMFDDTASNIIACTNALIRKV